MEVERAIVDLFRAFLMKEHVGERFEGTVTAVVGSGVFVQLDHPFVDVLVRLEDLGQDHWAVDDDALKVVAARSGDVVALGDRLLVEITDAGILRRTVYGKRVGGGGEREGVTRPRRPESKEKRGKPSPSHQDKRKLQRPARNDRNKAAPPSGKRPKGKGKGKKGRGR